MASQTAPLSELQAKQSKKLRPWHSGLLDCFEDAQTCCYGMWCMPCLACTVSGRMGEQYCLPCCDICAFYPCPIPPPAALALRVALRHRHDIKGSICKDLMVSWCCGVCSYCQMYRELKEMQKQPTVINMNTQQIISMQPAPVMMMMPSNPTQVVYAQPPVAIAATPQQM